MNSGHWYDIRRFDWLMGGFITTIIIYASPMRFSHPGWPYKLMMLFPIYALSFYFLCYVLLMTYWPRHKWRVIGGALIYYLVFSAYFVVADRFKGYTTWISSWEQIGELLTLTSYLYVLVLAASVVYFGFLSSQQLRRQQDVQLAEQTKYIHDLNQEKIFRQRLFDAHRTKNFLATLLVRVHQVPNVANLIEVYNDMLNFSMSLKPDELISLPREVEYIKQFIELEQEINRSQVGCIHFECVGNMDDHEIYPRLFITLVENAFHHGKTTDEENPVQIKLVADVKGINFYISNRKDLSERVSSGIGKVNLQETLSLYYPGRHALKTHETDTTYQCILSLTR